MGRGRKGFLVRGAAWKGRGFDGEGLRFGCVFDLNLAMRARGCFCSLLFNYFGCNLPLLLNFHSVIESSGK